MKFRHFVTVLILLSCIASASARDQHNKSDSLTIQEQGSFASGGGVITAPGTFDPIKHGAFNPADQGAYRISGTVDRRKTRQIGRAGDSSELKKRKNMNRLNYERE